MAENNEINFSLNTEQSGKAADDLTGKVAKATDKVVALGAASQKSLDDAGDAATRLANKVNLVISQTTRATQTRTITTAERNLDKVRSQNQNLAPYQQAQLAFERDISGKLSGNTKLIERRTEILRQLNVELKKQADQELREKAIQASKDTSGTDRFLAAERKVNQEKQQRLDLNNKLIQSELALAQRRSATPTELRALESNAIRSKFVTAGASPAELAALDGYNKKLELQTSLNRAIKASQDTSGADKFLFAERQVNREKQQRLDLNNKLIQSELAIAQRRSATPIELRAIESNALRSRLVTAGATPGQLATLDGYNKKLELQTSLNRAIKASQDTSGANQFAAALSKVNKEQQQEITNNAKIRESELFQARYRTASPVERIGLERTASLANLTAAGGSASEIAELEKHFKSLEATAIASSKNIGARIAEFITSPTYAARKSLGEFLQDFGKFGIIAGGILIGAAAAAGFLFEFVKKSAESVHELLNLSLRLNVSITDAAIFSNQAKLAGVEVENLSGLVRKLSTDLADGGAQSASVVNAFQRMGISVGTVGGGFRNSLSLLDEFSQKLSSLPSRAAQVDLLTRAFGRGAVELLPYILRYAELHDKSKELTLEQEEVYKSLEHTDTILHEIGVEFGQLAKLAANKIILTVEATGNAIGFLERSEKSAAGIAGVLAAGALVATNAPPPPIDIKVPAIGQKEVAKLEADALAAIERGNRISDAFNNRITDEGLVERLRTQTEALNTAEARLRAHGATDVAQKQNQAEATAAERSLEATKALIKDRSEFQTLIKSGQADLDNARKKEESGLLGLIDKYNVLREVAIKASRAAGGDTREGGLTTRLKQIDEQIKIERDKEANASFIKFIKQEKEADDAVAKAKNEAATRQLKDDKTFDDLRFTNRITQSKAGYDIEEQIAVDNRDRQLRGVELLTVKTLQQKLDLEQKKSDIEVRYLNIAQSLKEQALTADTSLLIARARADSDDRLAILRSEARQRAQIELEKSLLPDNQELKGQIQRDAGLQFVRDLADARFNTERDLAEKIKAITESGNATRLKDTLATDAAIDKSRQEAIIRTAEAIRDANTKVFDTFKRESEGVFDAMLTRSKNVFDAIGGALKNIFLTAFKDIVSTQVARQLTQLVTGEKVGLTPGVIGSGPLAKLAATLGIGAKPTFQSVQAKLEQAGHLGDLQLINGAAPVYVINQQEQQQQDGPVQSQINQGTPEQLSLTVPLTGIANFFGGNDSFAGTLTNALATLGLKKPTGLSPTTRTPIYTYDAPGALEAATYKAGKILLNTANPGVQQPASRDLILRHEEAHALLEPYIQTLVSDKELGQYADKIRSGLEQKSPVYQVNGGLPLENVLSEALAYKTGSSTVPGLTAEESQAFVAKALGDLDRTTAETYSRLAKLQPQQPLRAVAPTTSNVIPFPIPLPVLVTNAADLAQKVDIKSTAASSQVNQTLNFSVGAVAGSKARAPVAALVAFAVGIGQQAAAQALPAGYEAVSQGTSESIKYAGGGGEDFGEQIKKLGFSAGSQQGSSGNGSDLGVGSRSKLTDLFSAGSEGSVYPSGQGGIDATGIPFGTNYTSLLSSLPGVQGIKSIPTSGGSGGIAGALQNFKSSIGKFFDPNSPIVPGYSTTGASVSNAVGGGIFGKLAGGGVKLAASGIGLSIGSGLLLASTKQPYGAKPTASAAFGGALAGFSIGAQYGVGIAGAEIGAGAGLLISGLQTGGGTGFAKDVAGGALAGAAFGPLGIGIGAGVGALLGGLSLAGIIQTKSQKIKSQIKSLFGIDIRDQNLLSRMVQITNQQYGGSVDTAVRGIEIRQLVELYAQATGQNSRGIVAHAQASIFSNTGGKLTELPTYFNGAPVFPGDTKSSVGLPQITPNGSFISAPVVGGANATQPPISISLDGDASAAFLQGQTVQAIGNSPRLISSGAAAGMKASASNRQIAASVLSPAFLPG